MSESLLPPNATAQEDALALAAGHITAVPVPVRDVWNADTAPDGLLPWLAWAYSVDEWDVTWSPAQRREAIKRSVLVHRYKGTIGAVREALDALGFDVAVQEWFNMLPAGEPYTFDLNIITDQVGADAPALAKVMQIINSTKNLRSHLAKVKPLVVTRSEVFLGGVSSIGTDMTVAPGAMDISLLMEGIKNGNAQTEAAVDQFHQLLHFDLPEFQ